NPEPIADFIDAAVLGDGEEVVLKISEVVREWKGEGRPSGDMPSARDELLRRLAVSGGVYVPKFYDVSYGADGTLGPAVPDEVGLLSLSSADHTEIGEVAKDLADRYEGTNISLSLPSTRVDAFNITLANEFSRNGRRSGLTFAPEGGSERMRKVINKMVTEEDLIRTVATAYSHGWRQVKLYFMCGLPTETDEDRSEEHTSELQS